MSHVVPGTGSKAHEVDPVPWEARPFQGQPAGIVTRTVANAIDFGVVVAVLVVGYLVWCAVRFLIDPAGFGSPAPPFYAVVMCGAVVLFVYFVESWATTGRTYGDHLLGLRVVNFRGHQMRWSGAAVRAAFCVALPIGLYWAVVSPTRRSLQDTVLRTSVVYDWTTARPKRARPPDDAPESAAVPAPRSPDRPDTRS